MKPQNFFQFKVEESDLEIKDKYLYLGIIFTSTALLQGHNHVVQQANQKIIKKFSVSFSEK